MEKIKEGIIFNGRTSSEFGSSVLSHLKNKLSKRNNLAKFFSEGRLDISDFANGELNVQLKTSVRRKSVHFIQNIRQEKEADFHKDIFEIFIALDAFKRAGADEIFLYIPFIPYMRQDRKAEGREPISARTFFDLICAAGGYQLKRISTFDLHNDAEQGFANMSIDNISALPLFVLYLLEKENVFRKDLVIISPDAGGAKEAKRLRKAFEGTRRSVGLAIVDKDRKKGKEAQPFTLIGDVAKKTAVLLDDMIDTGGSVLNAAKFLKDKGAEDKVIVCCTHGIFSESKGESAEDKFRKSDIKVVTTNTVCRNRGYYKKNKSWLIPLSVAPYTADAIICNQMGESLSSVLNDHITKAIKGQPNISNYIIKY